MNPRYKIGVLLFGIFLPAVLVLGFCLFLSSKKSGFQEESDRRARIYQKNKNAAMVSKGLESQLEAYSDRKQGWDVVFTQSDVGAVRNLLKEIENNQKAGGVFKQNNFKFINNKTGIGAPSANPSISYEISLSGTFRALQESLLTLESRMPNLSLNSLKIEPDSNGEYLEAQLSYSAWTK